MTLDLATLNLKIDSREVAQGVGQLDRLTAAGTKAEQSTDRLGRQWVQAGSAAGKLRMEEAALEAEVQRLVRAQERAALTTRAQEIAQQRMGVAANNLTRNVGAQRAGMQQLGMQLGDMATMYSLGARPAQIFASQIGQVTQAVQLASGGTSRLAGFLGGPWGIALSVAVIALTPFIASLFEAEGATNALREAEQRLASSMTSVADSRAALDEALGRNVGNYRELRMAALDAAMAEVEGARAAMQARRVALQEAQGNRAILQGLAGQSPTGAMPGSSSAAGGLLGALFGFGDTGDDAAAAVAAAADLNEASAELTNIAAGLARSMNGSGNSVSHATRAATAATTRLTEAEREAASALEQRARATNNLIERMTDELAQLTMSEEAYAARELAMQRDNAVTAEQIAELDRLAAALGVVNGKLREEEEARARLDKLKTQADEQREAAEEAAKAFEDAQSEAIRDTANLYEALFTDGVDGVWDVFKKQGLAAISQLAAQWTLALLSGQSSGGNPLSAIGQIFGGGGAANDNGIGGGLSGAASSASGIASIFGGGSGGAASIGTALSATGPIGLYIAGVSLANSIGQGIEKLTGINYSKTGGFLGGLGGGFILGALKGTPKGVANLSGTSVLSSFGKFEEEATGAGGSVLDTLSQIAAALGINVGAGGAVSIGLRGNNWRVDPTGGGATKLGQGALDFGSDSEAAIAYAIRNLIEDGVLAGISQASKNILTSGSAELDAAIEKAVLIESVPKLLKERLDPLGFALDQIDEQFQSLADALLEGSATAQQFADAERLYNLEREAAIEQFGSASKTLQDFLSSLAYGSNSPLSVRSQLASAQTAFSTFESDIAAGKTVDQDAFTSAAQTLLGLSRQANGSTAAYFSTFDRVRALTQQAITNVGTSTPGDGSVVFQQQTASNTTSIAAMTEETNTLLRQQNAYLAQLIANDNGTLSGFIGTGRAYA